MSFRSRNALRLLLTGAVTAGLIGAGRVSLADGKPLFSIKPKQTDSKSNAAKRPATNSDAASANTSASPGVNPPNFEPPRLVDVSDARPIHPKAISVGAPLSIGFTAGASPSPAVTTASPSTSAAAAVGNVGSPILTVAGNDASGKSEVMKQLELLYQQDGREMPELQVMQPTPSDAVRAATGAEPANVAQPAPGTPQASGRPGVPPVQGKQAPTAPLPRTTSGAVPANQSHTKQMVPPARPNTAAVAPAAPAPIPSASEQQAANKSGPVAGFFKKLIPGKKDSTSTQAPPGYRADEPPTPPGLLPAQTNTPNSGYRPYAVPSQQANGSQTKSGGYALQPLNGANPSAGSTATTAAPVLTPPPSNNRLVQSSPEVELPPPPATAFTLPVVSGTPSTASSLPPLLSQPQVNEKTASIELPAPAGDSETPGTPEFKLPRPSDDPLANLFTEMSEEEADEEVDEEDEEDPFTGLALDDEDSAKTRTNPMLELPNVAAQKQSEPAEDPFAAELKKLGIIPGGETADKQSDSTKTAASETKPTTETKPTEPKAETKTVEKEKEVNGPVLAAPSPAGPSLEGIEDEATREKMKKIQERGGMKGLKGFCPVTLHDDRELVDASPEFHATHRGQKFHFATAQARDTFIADPSQYAPAAYGADVVALTRDKDVVEGTLDFAAWFKGRLYLFGTQEAHDEFVANPVQYATPAGIE